MSDQITCTIYFCEVHIMFITKESMKIMSLLVLSLTRSVRLFIFDFFKPHIKTKFN